MKLCSEFLRFRCIKVRGLNTWEGDYDMDDKTIIELFFERSEQAISEVAKKYGKYCHYIAFQILHNEEDSEVGLFFSGK